MPQGDRRGKEPKKVGNFVIYLGGLDFFKAGDLEGFDVIIPLDHRPTGGFTPPKFGEEITADDGTTLIISGVVEDFGTPDPAAWEPFLREKVIPHLQAGRKVLAYCGWSQGRTGTFYDSLIAILESAEETPDPIAAGRERHVPEAVETWKQASLVFALRGEEVPEKYYGDPSLQGAPSAPVEKVLAVSKDGTAVVEAGIEDLLGDCDDEDEDWPWDEEEYGDNPLDPTRVESDSVDTEGADTSTLSGDADTDAGGFG